MDALRCIISTTYAIDLGAHIQNVRFIPRYGRECTPGTLLIITAAIGSFRSFIQFSFRQKAITVQSDFITSERVDFLGRKHLDSMFVRIAIKHPVEESSSPLLPEHFDMPACSKRKRRKGCPRVENNNASEQGCPGKRFGSPIKQSCSFSTKESNASKHSKSRSTYKPPSW